MTSRETRLAVRSNPGNGGDGGATNAVVTADALDGHFPLFIGKPDGVL
jgi:hypothetical protein